MWNLITGLSMMLVNDRIKIELFCELQMLNLIYYGKDIQAIMVDDASYVRRRSFECPGG